MLSVSPVDDKQTDVRHRIGIYRSSESDPACLPLSVRRSPAAAPVAPNPSQPQGDTFLFVELEASLIFVLALAHTRQHGTVPYLRAPNSKQAAKALERRLPKAERNSCFVSSEWGANGFRLCKALAAGFEAIVYISFAAWFRILITSIVEKKRFDWWQTVVWFFVVFRGRGDKGTPVSGIGFWVELVERAIFDIWRIKISFAKLNNVLWMRQKKQRYVGINKW